MNKNWSTVSCFALALVCSVCNLSSVWKAPELLHKYGNIAAIIPYILIRTGIILPMVFAEIAVGQYTNSSIIRVWKMSPICRGVGWSSAAMLLVVAVFNNYFTTQAFYYIFLSVNLPWSKCPENVSGCFNLTVTKNGTKFEGSDGQNSIAYFYDYNVLKLRNDERLEGVNYGLILLSVAVLLLCFLVLYKRIQSVEKLLNFLVLCPFLLLIILLLTAIFYPGTLHGMLTLFKPTFSMLLKPKLWIETLNLHVVSSCVGMAILPGIAAHSDFRTNIYAVTNFILIYSFLRDIIFVIFTFSCFAAFSIWGNVDMNYIFAYDKSLIFIKIPLILLKWPYYPEIWIFLYFSYLFLVGFRFNLIAILILSDIIDDGWLKYDYPKSSVSAACATIFLLGLFLFLPSGYILHDTLEKLIFGPLIFLILSAQFIGFFYFYGIINLMTDIHFMLNKQSIILKYYWILIPPALTACFWYNSYIWVSTFDSNKQTIITVLQIGMATGVTLTIVCGLLVHVIAGRHKNFKQLFTADRDWGNRDPDIRNKRSQFKSSDIKPDFLYRQSLDARQLDGHD